VIELNMGKRIFYSTAIAIVVFVLCVFLFSANFLVFDEGVYSALGFLILWIFVFTQLQMMFH